MSNYWFWSGDWTEENKLTQLKFSNTDASLTDVDAQASYAYGSDGLRKQSSSWTTSGNNTRSVYYIYSGDTLIGEIDSTGTPVASYTWGPTGIVCQHRPTGSQWYCFGPQGETRALTNSAGTVVDTYAYNAYGTPIATTGTDLNPFRYGGSVGYYTDPHAQGLILCGQRWYSPGFARWLSRDPAGYSGGANLYAYCGDNPVGGLDPSGLKLIGPSADMKDFNAAINYLKQDSGMAHIIKTLQKSKLVYRVNLSSVLNSNDKFVPYTNGGAAQWNPQTALDCSRTGGTGSLSPAAALGHELAHAYLRDQDLNLFLNLLKQPDSMGYNNGNEKYVIENFENSLHYSLPNEGMRKNHTGIPYIVNGPLGH